MLYAGSEKSYCEVRNSLLVRNEDYLMDNFLNQRA